MKARLFLTALLIPGMLFAQEEVFIQGFFPEMAVSKKVSDRIKLTTKVESQHGTFTRIRGENAVHQYYHDRTDLQAFAAFSIQPLIRITGGYQYRIEGSGINNHRSIQQIDFLQRNRNNRIGYRIRADQTFHPEEAPLWRMRLRVAIEWPLQGKTLDPGELYLVASNEPIYGFQNHEHTFENRLVASLGRYFSKKARLEAGLDYRTDRFLSERFRQRLWFKVGCFLSL